MTHTTNHTLDWSLLHRNEIEYVQSVERCVNDKCSYSNCKCYFGGLSVCVCYCY